MLGRARERAVLDALTRDIQQGQSRSLVLSGEAGIGKTALLEHLIAGAPDLTVLQAVGVESEMELAYASLHQLCAPTLDRVSALPTPQRDALEIVFGKSDGIPPDRFLVGLAVLSLFAEMGEERPLLCVVDDAQWLDKASALTLAFVARRLLAERVGMVFAARQPGEELQQLPGIEVSGLPNDDARALLGSAVRFKLDEQICERIVAETRGNPLGLLELPRGLTATQLAGGFGMLDGQELRGRIEESFVRRLEGLSADARRLLLVAAAEPVGDPLLLLGASERLGIESSALDAETDGLLSFGERVIFRHPLVRSAMYRSAEAAERRAAHLALAEVTDRDADPDRRAWHLAAAAARPDEGVALELELSAGRAQARGGLVAAAAFLQRAVALTADPAQRTRRALDAAEANLNAGAFTAVISLLATAGRGSLDELQRAQVELLRGQVALFSTLGSDAPPLLLTAAQSFERVDAKLARDTYLDAWGAALFAGRLSSRGSLEEVSRAAKAARRPDGAQEPGDLLLESLATLVADGPAAAAPLLERATKTCLDAQIPPAESLRWGWLTVVPSYVLWDETSTQELCMRQLSALREAGALARLPIDLQTLSLLCVRCGDFAVAGDAIAEADSISEVTGTVVAPFSAMMLAALRGREAEARAMIQSTREEAVVRRQGVAIQITDWMLAVLCNGLGRYEEALASSQDAVNDLPGEIFISGWAAPELIEAAARTGRQDLAEAGLERLVSAIAIARTASARGIQARCRALVSEGPAAERLYQEALEQLGRSRLKPDLARAHLLYGEWLRREGRRVDARERLRSAYDLFTSIGMAAFAERARTELLATGEKARKRTVETRDDLTDQELHIARLARDGHSNPEIGSKLFLSPRTVEWHLRKVFGKLGIRSRHELSSALAGSEPGRH